VGIPRVIAIAATTVVMRAVNVIVIAAIATMIAVMTVVMKAVNVIVEMISKSTLDIGDLLNRAIQGKGGFSHL